MFDCHAVLGLPANTAGGEIRTRVEKNIYISLHLQLTVSLQQKEEENLRMKEERSEFEASIRKALLREVTALNIETIGIFVGKYSGYNG